MEEEKKGKFLFICSSLGGQSYLVFVVVGRSGKYMWN